MKTHRCRSLTCERFVPCPNRASSALADSLRTACPGCRLATSFADWCVLSGQNDGERANCGHLTSRAMDFQDAAVIHRVSYPEIFAGGFRYLAMSFPRASPNAVIRHQWALWRKKRVWILRGDRTANIPASGPPVTVALKLPSIARSPSCQFRAAVNTRSVFHRGMVTRLPALYRPRPSGHALSTRRVVL